MSACVVCNLLISLWIYCMVKLLSWDLSVHKMLQHWQPAFACQLKARQDIPRQTAETWSCEASLPV